MIIDVPMEEDFKSAGKDFLCLAWETLLGLLLDLKYGIDQALENDNQLSDAYWQAAQRPLSTALSLTEQAVEFLLKGKIAAVSPFLLITNDYTGWPKPSSENKLRFSEFKTVDAKDLVRVFNTTASSPLDDQFRQLFDQLRSKRNTIMHTVDPSLQVQAEEVMVYILEAHHMLANEERWFDIRRNHLQNSPNNVRDLYADSYSEAILIQEFDLAIKSLNPSLAMKYFGINKKQRRYLCPDCYASNEDFLPRALPTAILVPNSPSSKNIHCYLCDKDFDIERVPCSSNGCRGNVIYRADRSCLTCWADN